jgi:hypothetical protein
MGTWNLVLLENFGSTYFMVIHLRAYFPPEVMFAEGRYRNGDAKRMWVKALIMSATAVQYKEHCSDFLGCLLYSHA